MADRFVVPEIGARADLSLADWHALYDDPTAEDLGLPSDPDQLFATECASYAEQTGPAWKRYWRDRDALAGEANTKAGARALRSKALGVRRGRFRCGA